MKASNDSTIKRSGSQHKCEAVLCKCMNNEVRIRRQNVGDIGDVVGGFRSHESQFEPL